MPLFQNMEYQQTSHNVCCKFNFMVSGWGSQLRGVASCVLAAIEESEAGNR